MHHCQYLNNYTTTSPLTNINLLSVDYYWVRGGVGAQLLLYLHHRPSP